MQVKTQLDEIQNYLTDTSNISGGHADKLFIPSTAEEVSQILKEAAAERIGVTIAGARTGTVGGAVPFGGWVLSLEKINSIEIDASRATAICGAGATLNDVQNAANALGLFYAPDPTEWSCQIGGTVATNASGARSFKYGSTRDHVRRLKVVLSSGKIVEIRRGENISGSDGSIVYEGISFKSPTYSRPSVTKNASGYFNSGSLDLIDLFIGSEGTLGVIVEAELSLLPRPESTFSGVVFFAQRSDLLGFVDEARAISKGQSGMAGIAGALEASLLEYFDPNSLRFIAERFPESPTDVAGAVYFEQETTGGTEDALFEAWNGLLEKHGADLDRSWFTTNDQDKEKMRAFRHALPLAANERYSRSGFRKVSTDMAVPVDRFRSLLRFYEETCEASGIDHVIFGHIGDCHLHLNLFPKTEDEATRARHIYGRCVAQAIMLGGTVSAEHGIGKLKRKYLAVMMGERYLNEMAEIKRAFDPQGILGRGNIFDESFLNG